MSNSILRAAALFAPAFLAIASFAQSAAADTLVIKRPGAHPHYSFEAEPHLLLGFVDAPGHAHGSGYGAGFRGTLELLDNGFIPSINNTVGLGFGLDFVHYGHGKERCVRRGTADECVAFDDEFSVDNVWIPIVMQWNFWLSRNWSVFGEPGAAIRFQAVKDQDSELHLEPLQMFVGGRFHFTDAVTLTMRIGYPTFAIGVSFLL
jgi:hypothetical protein